MIRSWWRASSVTFRHARKKGRSSLAGGLFQFVPKEYLWDPPKPKIEKDEETGWHYTYRRVGVVGRKVGMTHDYTEWMEYIPLTIIKVEECYITQVKPAGENGWAGVQVGGGGLKKVKNTTRPLLKHFEKAGVPPLRKLVEYKVSPEAVPPVGTQLSARHFVPGQFLDIRGSTSGKGFQGAMKRWGFKGQGASHGVSKAHRSLGATGNCQDPGKTWKGKKMAGHMGSKNRTVKNSLVWKIDYKNNLLFVKGSVTGRRGTILQVKDAKNKRFEVAPPFPTFMASESEEQLPDFEEASLSQPYILRNQVLHPIKDFGKGEFDPAESEAWSNHIEKYKNSFTAEPESLLTEHLPTLELRDVTDEERREWESSELSSPYETWVKRKKAGKE